MKILILLALLSSDAFGGTYFTYKPYISLSPGQCMIMNGSKICAVKSYRIRKCPQQQSVDEVQEDAYLCEEGFITTNLTGWFLLKNDQRIKTYLSTERERCEQEIQNLKKEN